MGVLVQIRDVDESVRERLKHRAAEEGVSLNTYLRALLTRDAATPGRRAVLARITERGDLTATPTLDLIATARAERSRQPNP